MRWDKAWELVMEKGRKQEKGVTNTLDAEGLRTILATVNAFDVHPNFLYQVQWDLAVARYKVYDWVAMLLFGRYKGYGENEKQLEAQKYVARIMADAYLNSEGVEGFIERLKNVDYLAVEPMEIEFADEKKE